MKIGIQTLASKKFSVEIDEKENVLALKQRIHSELNLGEVEDQKLIFLGKVLKNEQSIESANIKPGGMIVLMLSKAKKPAPAAAEPAAAAAAAPAPVADSAAPTPAAQPAATPAPAANTPAATPSAQPASTPAATPAATPAPSGGATSAAANTLAMGAGLEAMITDLMALGFPRDQVQAALRASFNNPDRAADYLFNGIPENVMRDLNRPGQAAGGAGAGAGAAGAAGAGAGAGAQGQAPAANPPAAAGAGAGAGNPQANALAQLMANAQAAQAAQQRAAAGGGGAGAGGISADNPLAGLAANPQFQEMRAMLAAQPEMIPMLLQHLSQSQPELAQLIQQNPEALAELLGGAGAGAGAGAAGRGQPGQRTIQITMEEKQQLDNLEALGFPRQRALEAWLLCDRNEELAANYLFDHGNQDEDMGGAQ